jgi:2-polyprenyl-3-methyl-5-hydroxy-6-metoxy-1,4-benzoquinol methylase
MASRLSAGAARMFGTQQAVVEVLAELCKRSDRPRALDVGCGDGRHLLALAAEVRSGVGIDVSPDAIRAAVEAAARFDHLEFRLLPVERLPETELGRFELVLFIGSLEHMADPLAAIEAARSRLHPNGRVVIAAISPRAPHAVLSRIALRRSAMPVIGHLGVEGVRRLAARSGLRVEAVRPLYRGRGRSGWFQALLSVYDRLGGPTHAVVLAPQGAAPIPNG